MTHPCGCHTGPWMAVTPPPRCDGTNCSLDWTRRPRRATVAVPEWPSTWTQSSTTIKIPVAESVAEPTADESLAALIKHAHAESGRAEADGEHGAFDAWQAVIHALREVASRIAAAKAARP